MLAIREVKVMKAEYPGFQLWQRRSHARERLEHACLPLHSVPDAAPETEPRVPPRERRWRRPVVLEL
jgi:hypothetical protein